MARATRDRIERVGRCRAYRRACLEQISPLEEHMGWDGIDVLKADAARLAIADGIGAAVSTIIDRRAPVMARAALGLRQPRGVRPTTWATGPGTLLCARSIGLAVNPPRSR